MALTEIVTKVVIGGGKCVGRLGLEVAFIYFALRVGCHVGHEESTYAAQMYGIGRNGFDGIDAILWKQGRYYDYLVKPFKSQKGDPA